MVDQSKFNIKGIDLNSLNMQIIKLVAIERLDRPEIADWLDKEKNTVYKNANALKKKLGLPEEASWTQMAFSFTEFFYENEEQFNTIMEREKIEVPESGQLKLVEERDYVQSRTNEDRANIHAA